MKLTARLIAYHLKKLYPDLMVSSWLSCEPHLKYAVHYDDNCPDEDGRIYIVDNSSPVSLPHHLSKKMFLFTGASSDTTFLNNPNCCVLPEYVTVNQLLLQIQEIFQIYEQWNQALMDSRLSNGSVQNLIDLTDSIIPNPMMVIGMDFAIIASKKLSYGELKNSVLGSTEATQPLINALKKDASYEEAFHRTGYFYYPGNEVATPKLCVNITKSNKTVYRLMIAGGEVPLDDTFGFLLEYLAKMISHCLSINGVGIHDQTYSLRSIFATILTNPSADYVEVSQNLSNFGWLSSHHYQCALINTSVLDIKNMTLRSICSYVENIIPCSCALEYQNNAVVFINLTLCPMDSDEIFQKLAAFIRDSLLSAGYSRKMLGHFNFQRQYVQASIALQTGRRRNPSSWIHHFNQIALPYIFEQSTKKLPAYMICHEKLLSLKYEDETNHTQLYQTLRCYLEHHQNIARTSEALFIHRSTLLYRLDKIRRFMKSDFSNPEELLYLLLSFYFLEQEERSEKPY